MGKRKEEKYAKFRQVLEELRDPLTLELSQLVRSRYGEDAALTSLEFAMMHRRVFICHIGVRPPEGEPFLWPIAAKQSHDAATEFSCMTAVWEAGYDGAAPFGVRTYEPLGRSESSGFLFMELVTGHTCRNIMRETGSIEPARSAAQALLQLHALKLQVPAVSHIAAMHDHELMTRLRDMLPDLVPAIEEIVGAVQELERQHADNRIACHGDFHIAQVTLGKEDGTPWLMDYGSMVIADPALDLGEYLAHVQPEEQFSDVEGARRLFLEEYVAHTDREILSRVPQYEAIAWLRRAMHNVKDGPEAARFMTERAIAAYTGVTAQPAT